MFYLKKHYYDCIDKHGTAFIFYFAELKIFGFKVPYSSYILSNDKEISEKSILKKSLLEKHKIQNMKFQFFGNWNAMDKSISLNLLEEKTKLLKWDCHTPKAKVALKIKDQELNGLGYAETLEMNFTPWKLPISELKWGRFLSENHTIIWIEWIGEKPKKEIYWNGNFIDDAIITDNGIQFTGINSKLIFENPICIKNEKLLKIADKYPFLKLFFNKKFLQANETKFKSESTLIFENQSVNGFSLYEKVIWKTQK